MKTRATIRVDVGAFDPRNPNYGLPVDCYLCGTTHGGLGVGRVRHGKAERFVALCMSCTAFDCTERIARKDATEGKPAER